MRYMIEPDSPEMCELIKLPIVIENEEPFYLDRAPLETSRMKEPTGALLIPDKIPYQISRRHCSLMPTKKGLKIADSSRLGTLVDGTLLCATKGGLYAMTIRAGEHKLVLGPPSSHFRFKLVVELRDPR